jgi:methionyl-tRNA formyltransferase
VTAVPGWWLRPRHISLVVDNDSWILPYAERLTEILRSEGDDARLYRGYRDIDKGVAALFIGCVNIAPTEILSRNRYNLIVHESNLPQGRGFAPLFWQILEGKNEIDICLLEADVSADTGAVYLRDKLEFEGHELNTELRAAQGEKTIEMYLKFLRQSVPPEPVAQQGPASTYQRRRPADSRLDMEHTLAEQFNLLRTVDNQQYPAFFDFRGYRYQLTITKVGKAK